LPLHGLVGLVFVVGLAQGLGFLGGFGKNGHDGFTLTQAVFGYHGTHQKSRGSAGAKKGSYHCAPP
jgi:hypothetical protein